MHADLAPRNRSGQSGCSGSPCCAACSTDAPPPAARPASPTPPAAPAPASRGVWPPSPSRSRRIWPGRRSTSRDRRWCPTGWTLSVWARIPKARLAAWTPDGALLVSVPASGQIVKLTPKPGAAPQESVLLEGLDQPHGMAFAGSDPLRRRERPGRRLRLRQRSGHQPADRRRRTSRRAQPRTARRLRACAEERRRRTRRCGVLLDRFDRQHLRRDRDANPPRATIMRIPPGGGAGPAVRDGRPQRHGPRHRPGRLGVDGGQQPRQRSRPGRRRRYRVRQRAPAGVPGSAHPGPRTRLAFLQSRRRPRRSAIRPRYVRPTPTGREWTARHCRRSSRALARTRRRSECPSRLASCRSHMRRARWSACTAHGTGSPPRAPEVSFFPWQDGNLGDQQTLVGGFQAADGSRWGRPVAAVAGPDGAVYITDDYAGAVYRLTPPGR